MQVSLADGDNDDAIVSQLTVGANSSLTELSAMRVQAEFDTNEVVALMSSLIDERRSISPLWQVMWPFR